MIVLHAVSNALLALAAAGLLVLPAQPLYWRCVFGLILASALWDLTGLIWLQRIDWPGGPVLLLALVLLLGGLLFARDPPATGRGGRPGENTRRA